MKPGAFFTGEARMDAGLRHMTVTLCFDKDTKDREKAHQVKFEAETAATT